MFHRLVTIAKSAEINHLLSHHDLGMLTLRKTNNKSCLHQQAQLLSCTVLIPMSLQGRLTALALPGKTSISEREVNSHSVRPLSFAH